MGSENVFASSTKRRVLVLVLGALALTGCGSALSGLACAGDYPALAPKLAERQAAGTLGNREARVLAHNVARYELTHARGNDRDVVVSALAGCVAPLKDALRTVADGDDDAAAEAALLLFETGNYPEGRAEEHLQDTRDRFRALGTRTLVSTSDGPLRRARFVDPSGDVRLAAFRAALEAADGGDADALAEAVVKEPLPLGRTLALRALAIGARRGRANQGAPEKVVVLLRDLLARPSKEGIPLAEDAYAFFAQPPFFAAGGEEMLTRGFAKEVSPATIAGAIATLQSQPPKSAIGIAAQGLLLRALTTGSEREQRFVYAAAPRPLAPELLAVAKKHAESTDRALAVVALDALVDSEDQRAVALDRLAAYAKPLAAAPEDPVARAARGGLARRKVAAVQAWLENDLSGSRSAKWAAVSGLAALDRAGRAAPLLADGDRTTRLAAACTIVRGE